MRFAQFAYPELGIGLVDIIFRTGTHIPCVGSVCEAASDFLVLVRDMRDVCDDLVEAARCVTDYLRVLQDLEDVLKHADE